MLELHKSLDSVVMPRHETFTSQFYANPIEGFPEHFYGRNQVGLPTILISCPIASTQAPKEMASLQIRYGQPCLVDAAGKEKEFRSVFTAITCTSEDEELQRCFSFACASFVRILGNHPSEHDIHDMVMNLADLFRKLSRPATKELHGLFGELYYISHAKSPEKALAAWHVRNADKYDFVAEKVCLEVKSFASKDREHQFSQEQCEPPSDKEGLLVSIFIEDADVGLSLEALYDRIAERVCDNPALVAKLRDNVAICLGNKLGACLERSIDEGKARESIKVYALRDVPSISSKHIPPEVSKVKFASSLNHIKDLDVKEPLKNPELADFLPV